MNTCHGQEASRIVPIGVPRNSLPLHNKFTIIDMLHEHMLAFNTQTQIISFELIEIYRYDTAASTRKMYIIIIPSKIHIV